MNIIIIVVGNLKEKYWIDAAKEYIKRLSRFCKLSIIEIKEEKLGQNPSAKEIENALAKEKEGILKNIPANSYTICLDIDGKNFDSEELSTKIQNSSLEYKQTVFVIGSSYGLDINLKKSANLRWSFSKLTFPHQMVRVILLVQIYRAFKIKNNEVYHK